MIRAIVTDIEGTTSSISFVKEVLFPYARAHLPAFVAARANEPDVQRWLREAAHDGGLDPADRQGVIDLLIRWIDEDRKVTPLKALQGLIWDEGYRRGKFHGHVYPEVAAQLEKWKKQGIALYVYSSGSVAAQKLLFAHSEAGDLTALFSGYFDTEIGGKRERDAYRRIAEAIGVPAADILFLSDVAEELDAAHSAGLATTQLIRDSDTVASSAHPSATNFEKIQIY